MPPSSSAGNLACDAVAGGRIIFYDFGMMDELTRPLKRAFSDLIFGIYGNDVMEVVDSLEEMDVIRKVSHSVDRDRAQQYFSPGVTVGPIVLPVELSFALPVSVRLRIETFRWRKSLPVRAMAWEGRVGARVDMASKDRPGERSCHFCF